LRTCTSSLTLTVMGMLLPSATWTPAVLESASGGLALMDAVGGTPLVSNGT
jgi:hypothetical protein